MVTLAVAMLLLCLPSLLCMCVDNLFLEVVGYYCVCLMFVHSSDVITETIGRLNLLHTTLTLAVA